MKASSVNAFFNRLKKLNPHPTTELAYTNAYTLLVATVLAAQATDVSVNKATKALFAKIKTPEPMVKLGERGLKKYIKTIGLFNMKAKNVIALSKRLVKDFDGEVPHDREALQSLPGVGRKTANVVLNVVWGEPTMPVDTHVFRVANRTGLADGKTPEEVEEKLLKVVPKKFLGHAHHWLVLHGRYVCKARAPECARCPVSDLCLWPEKTA